MGKAKKVRKIKANKELLGKKLKQILAAYELFDDNDISTERLLAMVADHTGCEIDEVIEAIYFQSL